MGFLTAEGIKDQLDLIKSTYFKEGEPPTGVDLVWLFEQVDRYVESLLLVEKAEAEVKRLQKWVDDLQSGMYINCVYCGFRYGPKDKVPATMADALKEHIEQCPKHPMSALKAEVERLRGKIRTLITEKDHNFGPGMGDFLYAQSVREWAQGVLKEKSDSGGEGK